MDKWTIENLRKLAAHFGFTTDDVEDAAVSITATAFVRICRLEAERDEARDRAAALGDLIAEHMSEKHGLSTGEPDEHDELLWAQWARLDSEEK